jgi:hypothetical protein
VFNPSKEEVRRFFCETWKKSLSGAVLTPLEAIAHDWIRLHPEYEHDLADSNSALVADYDASKGKSNPFLHLSMHLSIAEQVSVDQPPGISEAFNTLVKKCDSEHDAHHHIMECLGEMLWISQRNGTPPDGLAYVECVRRRAQT